jgi:predicted nucleotidyltransferase
MNKHDLEVLSLLKSHIRQHFPDAAIWAFGSRVKGNAAENSDLDLCIVVDILNDDTDKLIMDIAWEVGFENDIVISTVTFSREEFENGPCSASPLVRNILKEGVAA